MTFRVGQRVVCVDAGGFNLLIEGAVYTVLELAPSGFAEMIAVDSKPDCFGYRGYNASRFRPIVERKTSIEVFQRMLNPSEVEA